MGSRLEKKSTEVRKRIENHEFNNEEGEEYEGSKFGGFSDYFRRKKIKLQNLDVELRASSSENPRIFRGIVVHVNGYTQPSLNDLHHLIVSHGGGFMQYLDGKTQVTHIVASSLTPKKVEEFRRYRIVKPAWIVDSVKAGKLLPWSSYRVVDEGTGQKVLHFDNGKITSQVNQYQRGYRDQTDTSWYTNQLASTDDTSNTQLPTPDVSSPARTHGHPSEMEQGENGVEGELEREVERDAESEAEPATIITEDQKPNADSEVDLAGVEDGDPVSLGEVASALSDNNHIHRPSSPSAVANQDDAEDTVHPRTSSPSPNARFDEPDLEIGHEEGDVPFEATENENLKRKLHSPSQASPVKKAKLTAEEHNAILLSDPRIRKSSVLNPDFIEQYYRESRLHHLSAWKAELKSQLQAMTADKSASQKAAQKRPAGSRRYILHVDFDSFFIAVSLKNYPQYVETPACVAHSSGNNSEIASCNYPARKFGVKNGMWMRKAQELCADLKVLPYDFPGYEAASKLFYEAILATEGVVQSISIDEALVDITTFCLAAAGSDGVGVNEGSIWREQAKADEIAQQLRDHVKEKTGCAVSVGIGGNILLAKTALRKAKPAGQYQVKPEEALDFIGELLVQDLPGVAYSIGGKLEEIGIKLVKDVRECSREKLVNVLGPKTGEKIWNYSKAIDRSEVGEQVVRKSVSAEINWGVRFETQEQAESFIESLCGELNRRLLKEQVKGKQMTMKIMRRAADAPLDPPKHLGHGKCDTVNKSVTLGVATNAKEVLTKEALSILRFYNIPAGELRGLGVQMTKLESLKPAGKGEGLGSQKRLQFTSAAMPDPPESYDPAFSKMETIEDVPLSSQKHLRFKPVERKPNLESEESIQDDVETPEKPKNTQVPTDGVDGSSPTRKPLNTLGTQFILPSQVDPSVLAELPEDVRSKLSRVPPQTKDLDPKATVIHGEAKSKPPSSTILPNQSQLDPEILDALPEDVRSEILAHYASSPTKGSGQALLPQSPRKTKTLPPTRKAVSSRGRGRGSGSLLSRLKGSNTRNPGVSTLTQSNFVARAQKQDQTSDADHKNDGSSEGKIADDFLDALPEDIRREVLAQHRAEQRKRNAGIEVSSRRAHRGGGNVGQTRNSRQRNAADASHAYAFSGDAGGQKERVLLLPRKPDKPGFTTRKLSNLEDLRGAVSLWHEEFKDDGPYTEDVEALGKYLQSVVCEEQDMGKAVAVVKWMQWVVGDPATGDDATKAEIKWAKALETAKDFVKAAVQSRGLGAVEL